jgi:hypothetical protein
MEQEQLQKKLQFILDSGWDINKGALPARIIMATANEINGDIHILPVFDGFHDEVSLYYYRSHKKNVSPVGDIWFLRQDPCLIDLGLTLDLPKNYKRKRGEHIGTYWIFTKKDFQDFNENVRRKGYTFDYNPEKRLFEPVS